MEYTCIRAETRGAVGLVGLDRPKVLNALNRRLIEELGEALAGFDAEDAIGAMVITGNEKAFAAGADISEMVDKSSMDMFTARHFEGWERIEKVRKPVIAAVAGYALGGGCELAMACDIVIAADNARFGQPEIKLGVLPGLGGTQRLPRVAGKAKAMDLCLTARMMDAEEAERSGLASRVVPLDRLLDEAMETATVIASMSRPAVLMVKEAIDQAYETNLQSGLDAERIRFDMSFSSADKHEGMRAFLEKRTARWKHR
ncbi:MAG: enoyl-CoA hydratase [Thiotrichales bacterium]|nr:enoyl-CoA hydratase [Thiotrichales bacterium]